MSDGLRQALEALTLREPDTPKLWEQSNNVELTGGERIAYEWGVTDTLSDVRAILSRHPTGAAQIPDGSETTEADLRMVEKVERELKAEGGAAGAG